MRKKQTENSRHFWNWSNEGGERVLYLYGTIAAESWFDDEVPPDEFRQELQAGTGPVTVYLNSPGGDCVAASQIYTMLMDYPDEVTIKIDGIAASAASVIAMAGTAVLMAPTALMMLHNPATAAFGDHTDMEKAIELLETVKESIVNAYEIRTNLDRKTLAKMMEEETWMDAGKAIELGFADGLIERTESRPVQVQNASVLFSQKKVDRELVNRLKEADSPEDGISVLPLYDRLYRLRDHNF